MSFALKYFHAYLGLREQLHSFQSIPKSERELWIRDRERLEGLVEKKAILSSLVESYQVDALKNFHVWLKGIPARWGEKPLDRETLANPHFNLAEVTWLGEIVEKLLALGASK